MKNEHSLDMIPRQSSTISLKQSLLDQEDEPISYWVATRKALSFGLPSVITHFATLLAETANQIFIGQLGVPELTAAIGLGNMVLNVCCVSIAMGLNGALDTLVSQAFGRG